MRALTALALVGATLLPTPARAEITPGCDDPVDVVCNMGWSPDHPSTPMLCVLWMQGRGCVIRG